MIPAGIPRSVDPARDDNVMSMCHSEVRRGIPAPGRTVGIPRCEDCARKDSVMSMCHSEVRRGIPLRRQGVDVLTAREANMLTASSEGDLLFPFSAATITGRLPVRLSPAWRLLNGWLSPRQIGADVSFQPRPAKCGRCRGRRPVGAVRGRRTAAIVRRPVWLRSAAGL
jgi:hypothetical protein